MGWSNSTAGLVFALYVADLGLIPNTQYGPLCQSGVIQIP